MAEIFQLGDSAPEIDGTAWVAPGAVLVGRVILRARASIWFNAVLRGDNEPIEIGAGANVQDGAVLHTDPGFPLIMGEDCTIGHRAIVHGCVLGEGALVGMGATVMNGAKIGAGCLIGANALVTEGSAFEPGGLILGAPAKRVRELSSGVIAKIRETARRYQLNAIRFRETARRVG